MPFTALHRTILVALLALALLAAAPGKAAKPARPANEAMTGVLAAVDPEKGTITLERVGADVDEVLLEKMQEQGRASKDKDKKDHAGDAAKSVVTVSAKAKLYIKFRSSPSVANNVEQKLDDLKPMVGWPVSVKVREKAAQPVAYEVIAWRGTPWKGKVEK